MPVNLTDANGEVVATHVGEHSNEWVFQDIEVKTLVETLMIEGVDDGHRNYLSDDPKFAGLFWKALSEAGYEVEDEVAVEAKMQVADLYITKATRGKDGVMRWSATVSKFEPDTQSDEVTPEFYQHAIGQIQKGLRPYPVLCLSHVDLGAAHDGWVVGDAESMFIDGDLPKAKGTLRDTPLGRATFKALRTDQRENLPREERARISMGFYDEGSRQHVVKGPDGDETKGRKFFKGWVKHLAVTRVPVVRETNLEARMTTKSKVTLFEDVASIVGEELAEKLIGVAFGEVQKGLIEKAALGQDQIRSLIAALKGMLGSDEVDEVAQVAALGSDGTEPPPAVPAKKADTEEGDEDEDEDEDEEPKPKPVDEETEDEDEDEDEDTKKKADVDSIVEGFALNVKAALRSDGGRHAKFEALNGLLAKFGEEVGRLVKGTPPDSRDIGELIKSAVTQAVAPLQHEVLQLKAQLATAGQPPAVPLPKAMDGRVLVTQEGEGLGAAPIKKAYTAAELADLSTQAIY